MVSFKQILYWESLKGKSHSKKHIEKIRQGMLGKNTWMKGRTNHISKVGKLTISLLSKERNKEEKHGMWKGDKVGYGSLHEWVRKHFGKATKCSKSLLHKGRFVWANISGQYKRELSDWHELCDACNMTDGIHIHRRFIQKGGD